MTTVSPPHGSTFLDEKVLGKELEDLLDQTSRLDVCAKELRLLAEDLTNGDRLDRWAEVDLVQSFVRAESLADPPQPAPSPNQPWWRPAWSRRSPRDGVLEAALGVLVFVPLLVTWFGLREAVRAYGELARDRPEEATRPFLQLWQSGFDGRLSALGRFENVALTAALLITLLVLLSVWHARVRTRTERDEEAREAADGRLLGSLAALLTRVQMSLAPHRRASPEQFTQELTHAAEQLRELTERADESHKTLAAGATAVGKATDALRKAAAALSGEVPRIGGAADRVEGAVKASLVASTQARQANEDAARGIADRVQAAGDTVRTAFESLVSVQQALAAKSDTVAQAAERAAEAVAAGAERTNDAVDGMREATERWDAAAAHWQDAAARLDRGIRGLAAVRPHPAAVNGAPEVLETVPAQSNGVPSAHGTVSAHADGARDEQPHGAAE
ncbi:hypothetical protein PV729_02500 [Streptomyces europaeiscabiei]|uniref:Methyl-accepting chemotaxis protein n=1 Tax=Streptomyces europaeiscabiei TaxID=146819 RepID=A0ABU4N7U1_9ACTN|nr:hypothetical protein [Streptomyces europaeiscabiei]MDX3542810.1 hypothetical protein [Streptomyces europaeiscabiei]MDX3550654.1 hypothetical protein [Streptomyces europaeiscabiei]MDX3698786.1 hypothetical protein [Streptomyces europaeiscabiei]